MSVLFIGDFNASSANPYEGKMFLKVLYDSSHLNMICLQLKANNLHLIEGTLRENISGFASNTALLSELDKNSY